ncbi:hypothetical protein Metok_0397 [Methanothermococcus okinawensis IH1]|uniref:Uncharacterized protein n=1 Tax=Methanothermococcus okinawensis (strain DSM 14208 / JCM 11175 / IH1) TaxID=647113 RepID=F8AKY3_METOI|nr:hypothetical protein Metok_0397 [Methanothermococcus okinawensis IH1]
MIIKIIITINEYAIKIKYAFRDVRLVGIMVATYELKYMEKFSMFGLGIE